MSGGQDKRSYSAQDKRAETAKPTDERGQRTAPWADTNTRYGKGGQNSAYDAAVHFCIKVLDKPKIIWYYNLHTYGEIPKWS